MKIGTLGKIMLAMALCLHFSGCTKEKAEAIKMASENFRVHADAALEKMLTMQALDVAIPADAPETQIAKVIKDLMEAPEIKAETIGLLLKELNATNPPGNPESKKQIAALRQTYAEFAAMYANLPRGSFLAGEAVQRSERLSVLLTKQMINLAQLVEKAPFKLNARIIGIRQQAAAARATNDNSLKEEKLRAVAQELIRLKADTDAANQELVGTCLKAAEAGMTVAELIRNYNKFTAPEIIALVQQSVTTIASLSGKDASTITNRLTAIKAKIERDPIWRGFEVEFGAQPTPGAQN